MWLWKNQSGQRSDGGLGISGRYFLARVSGGGQQALMGQPLPRVFLGGVIVKGIKYVVRCITPPGGKLSFGFSFSVFQS